MAILKGRKKGGAGRPSLEIYIQAASEIQFQGHMHFSGIVDLTHSLPEVASIPSGTDVAELRMVEGIERFYASRPSPSPPIPIVY
jgi:hypothetical protein